MCVYDQGIAVWDVALQTSTSAGNIALKVSLNLNFLVGASSICRVYSHVIEMKFNYC